MKKKKKQQQNNKQTNKLEIVLTSREKIFCEKLMQ